MSRTVSGSGILRNSRTASAITGAAEDAAPAKADRDQAAEAPVTRIANVEVRAGVRVTQTALEGIGGR